MVPFDLFIQKFWVSVLFSQLLLGEKNNMRFINKETVMLTRILKIFTNILFFLKKIDIIFMINIKVYKKVNYFFIFS